MRRLRRHSDLFVWNLFLLAVSLIPHFFLFPLGFYSDDIPVLGFLQNFSWTSLFWSRETFALSGSSSFTPLLYLSLLVDFKLTGFNGLAYSVHNWLSSYCLGVAAMFFLRSQRLSTGRAVLASSIIILLPSVVAVSAWASTRHYLEGMIWALLSLTFLSYWAGQGKKRYLFFSFLFYYLALLSKEIYLPVIAVSILFPWPSKKRFVAAVSGFGCLIVLYFLHRYLVIGALVSEQSYLAGFGTGLSYLALSLPRFAALSVDIDFFGLKAVISTVLSIGVVVAAFTMFWREERWAGIAKYVILLLSAVVIVAPVLGDPRFDFAISHDLRGNRFIFMFSIMLFVVFFMKLDSCFRENASKKIFPGVSWCLLAVFMFIGPHQALGWKKVKLTRVQWQSLLTIVQKENRLVVGPVGYLVDLGVLCEVIPDQHAMMPKTIGIIGHESDLSRIRQHELFLILPGFPVRSAASSEEATEWIRKYHRYDTVYEKLYEMVDV